MDLDQSGSGYQSVNVYLGPSLGWVKVRVKPQTKILAAGTTTLTADASVILVNINGLVTLNLPDVTKWIQETAYMPATAFERAVWIKDLGGFASPANPITVAPFGTQTIDGLAQSYTIIQTNQLLKLYPLNDLTGWFAG